MLESYFRIENWFCPGKKKKRVYIYGTLVLIRFVCRSLKWNRLKCWNISTADIEVKFWKHWAMGQELCLQTFLNHGGFLRYIYLPKLKNIQLFHPSTSLLHTWTFIYADLKSEKHFLNGGGEGRKTAIFSLFWNSEVEWQLNE